MPFARFLAALIELLLRLTVLAVQMLVHITVLVIFLLVLWASGLWISTGVSLWRLIQHGYGTTDGDPSKANMTPALDVLYTLVVTQGAIFLYAGILRYLGRNVAQDVAEEYGFQAEDDVALVAGYLEEARTAWFAKGRNLVTYAVGLMGCDKSPTEHKSGTRILGIMLGASSPEPLDKYDEEEHLRRVIKNIFAVPTEEKLNGQHMLIKRLIGGLAPSSQTLQEQLLQMLNSSRYDAETRECAARIVAHVADTIHLEKFPWGIQSISSLLETFEEYHHRALCLNPNDSDIPSKEDYKELLVQGLHIIWLLSADENNRRVIGEARGLLPKIMAPLTSDLLDSDVWFRVVEGSLKVIHRLTTAPREVGDKLRRDISTNKEAICAMLRILKCHESDHLWISTLEILARLDLNNKSKQDFVKMLVDTFTDSVSDGSVVRIKARASAGEALATLSSKGGRNDTIILLSNGDYVDHLAAVIVNFGWDDSACLISGAEILENLCIHYTEPDEDEHRQKLKQAMTSVVMPKVLRHIFPGQEATRRGTEADIPSLSSPHGDIEDQQDNDAHHNIHYFGKETQEQRLKRKVQAALLSLCAMVWNKFVSGDQDMALHFDPSSLPRKLKGIVAKNSDRTASCLRIIKATSRMVIAMMKHKGNYPKQDLEILVNELQSASSNMILVDKSTVFANGDESTTKHARTLKSLVEEAWELVHPYEAEELQVMEPL